MEVSRNVIERTDMLVNACGLDTLSIFFRDFNSRTAPLTYLHHHGVSQAAQAVYLEQGIYEEDPFTRICSPSDRCGQLVRWEDRRLSRAASRAPRYRDFIYCHDVDVVAAWVQQIMPGFLLVIGTHCRSDGHARSEVGQLRLEAEVARLSQMVIGELLEKVLAQAGGTIALEPILNSKASVAPADPMEHLTSREREIACLVGAGQLNKQVAARLGISEFTVENHLRRIYSKLGIHNRAALAACLFSPRHLH